MVIEGDRIASIDTCDPETDPEAHALVPGFVDLQVNGIDAIDVATATGDADWHRLGAALLVQGVTTWCPTLVSADLASYAAPLGRIADAMVTSAVAGEARPRIAGAHLEGPFLGGAGGAHRRDAIVPIDLGWLRSLPQHVAVVTLGPEQPDAVAAIGHLARRGVLVAVGHTTATVEQFDAAVVAGARLVTHLFNGMSGIHHRDVGIAACAITEPLVAASLIADGVHVHPRVLRLAFQALGAGRSILVTDSVAWRSGRLGGIGIELRDGAPRLPNGTLAGSHVTMDAAIRTCVAAGIDLRHAVEAASTTPARLLGLDDRGVIAPGATADLVALSPDHHVDRVWVGGVASAGLR